MDHPADNQVDYNSIIDFLEEEHMRREVFTTAIDSSLFSRPGHLSENSLATVYCEKISTGYCYTNQPVTERATGN